MSECRCGCGREVPQSRGFRTRIWYDDACRKRAARRIVAGEKETPRDDATVDLDALLVPGDEGVVVAVRRLVESLPLNTGEERAQAALAGELAWMTAAGSVPA